MKIPSDGEKLPSDERSIIREPPLKRETWWWSVIYRKGSDIYHGRREIQETTRSQKLSSKGNRWAIS